MRKKLQGRGLETILENEVAGPPPPQSGAALSTGQSPRLSGTDRRLTRPAWHRGFSLTRARDRASSLRIVVP